MPVTASIALSTYVGLCGLGEGELVRILNSCASSTGVGERDGAVGRNVELKNQIRRQE